MSQEKFMACESADERLALYLVHYKKDLPLRTDDGEEAAPFLRVKEGVKEPEGPKWTRAQMYDHLLTQQGNKCQDCDRTFDNPRYLELDHNIPRSDGGINHITNRILLCGPCNKLKSNIYTLSGLRRENKKRGHLRI
ncbi:MAG: HNH endonuclease [Synechococcus sp. SB0673_bin_10]|nr:HNH endonuclease [Synechococcus sp. SB0667_bin_8]MYI71118.1 HNH endonuclease [Synechococcus sp. SB0673_bin_10]